MGLKYLYISQKVTKKSPSSLGLRHQTPVSDAFEYTSLLNTSPKLDICTF